MIMTTTTTTTTTSSKLLPLRGVNVLDMSRVLAGPWCTMLLADLGATVLKVERPGVGDETRSWGPPFVSATTTTGGGGGGEQDITAKITSNNNKQEDRLSTYFLSVNRGKKSLAVDLKAKEGLDICRQLAIDWADVVVENFKPGTMTKMGLDYSTLSQTNHGLVYCSVTGFGPDGPLSDRPGYDVIVSGMYGLMSITGSEQEPAKVGVASTDVLTGTLAHSGILAALYQRQHTGQGQKVDVSLMESQLAGLVNIASSSLNTNNVDWPRPKRWGTAHESIVPYQAFECKKSNNSNDEQQYILVGAGNDTQFYQLCQSLGRPDLTTDERFRTNALRVQYRDELLQDLETVFRTKSRDEWMDLLQGHGYPIGPLRTVQEAFDCEQSKHRQMVQTMDHPVVGQIHLPRTPISFSSSSPSTTSSLSTCSCPPPMLGQDTHQILTEILGYDTEFISELTERQIIECYGDK